MKLTFIFASFAIVFLTTMFLLLHFNNPTIPVVICSFVSAMFIRATYEAWKEEGKK